MQSFSYLLDNLYKNKVALAFSDSNDGIIIDDGLRRQFCELLGITDQYNACTFGDEINMTILHNNVTVNRDDCFELRPLQRSVEIEEVETHSILGEGWDCPEAIGWFRNNPAEKQGTRLVSVQTMAEDEVIYQTMSHVKWNPDTDGPKLYKFKCDMKQLR